MILHKNVIKDTCSEETLLAYEHSRARYVCSGWVCWVWCVDFVATSEGVLEHPSRTQRRIGREGTGRDVRVVLLTLMLEPARE